VFEGGVGVVVAVWVSATVDVGEGTEVAGAGAVLQPANARTKINGEIKIALLAFMPSLLKSHERDETGN
jgi:hypothetical protein